MERFVDGIPHPDGDALVWADAEAHEVVIENVPSRWTDQAQLRAFLLACWRAGDLAWDEPLE